MRMEKEMESEALASLVGAASVNLVSFLLDLGISFSSENNRERLLEKIVDQSLILTNADGCTLYLLGDDGKLHFTISKNNSLRTSLVEEPGKEIKFPPVPMDPAFVSAYVAINKRTVNVPDVYASREFDFTGPKKYDRLNGYHSVSMLVAPLMTQSDEVIGVLQLLNSIDPVTGAVVPFDAKYELLIQSLASYAAIAIWNTRLVEETRRKASMLKEANMDAIFSLAMAAEAKDDDTGEHVRRIQMYSTLLAHKAGLGDDGAEEIGYSSIMHDVGKISVPDGILKKPGKLTDQEYEIMKAHTFNGAQILPQKPFFTSARRIAHSHHERWDGRGYPDNLMGEDIPLEARIVAIADVFDALTSKRPYKEPWPFDRAMAEISANSGAQFDPSLVRDWESLYRTGALHKVHRDWSG